MSTTQRQKGQAASGRADIYARVTDQIIAELEKGAKPWHRPWDGGHTAGDISRPLRHNGQAYRGINVVMLWLSAELGKRTSPFWLTFQQAKELGGFVRKGEQGSPVVYASTFKKTETGAQGEELEAEIPFLKQYTVFNAEQCEGLPEHFTKLTPSATQGNERIEHADQFFQATQADIRNGGLHAYYSPGGDYVQMPPLEIFESSEAHAATLAHELTHWTRHERRLNRSFEQKRFGDAGYAMEELVAELGAAFLCADLKLTPHTPENHASYLDSWLKVLKSDKKAIFTAASHATKALDYLHGLQPQPA